MKEFTTVNCLIFEPDGKIKHMENVIYYRDVNKYDDLPDPCKCEQLRKEFEHFRQKKLEEMISNEIIRNIDRVHKRKGGKLKCQ